MTTQDESKVPDEEALIRSAFEDVEPEPQSFHGQPLVFLDQAPVQDYPTFDEDAAKKMRKGVRVFTKDEKVVKWAVENAPADAAIFVHLNWVTSALRYHQWRVARAQSWGRFFGAWFAGLLLGVGVTILVIR